jgi:HlyD family secretion protein
VSTEDEAQDILNTIKPRKKRWRWIVLLIIIIALVAGASLASSTGDDQKTNYITSAVDRGDVILTATSTGNLEPRRQVTIGAEVSGKIIEVLVEENDRVEVGQVLARLDISRVDNERAQLRAQLQGANANVRRVQATIDEIEITLTRTSELVEQGASPQSALDQIKAQNARAKADLSGARADVSRVRSSISALDADLERATITSPIAGVVLSRTIEPGSTVAASFQAPELFVLAEDLAQMELHVLINEADISLVNPEQRATFTVDAWPEKTFEAFVKTVSLSPSFNNNVVSYKTILSVDNAEHLLRPGMTASAVIQTGTREDVLRVPTEALWFEPPKEESGFRIGPKRRERTEKQGSAVHVLRDDKPVKVSLRLGRSDEDFIEVLEGDLKQGEPLITGIEEPEEAGQEPQEPRS